MKLIRFRNIIFYACFLFNAFGFNINAQEKNDALKEINIKLKSNKLNDYSKAYLYAKKGKILFQNENFIGALNFSVKSLTIYQKLNDSLNIGKQKAYIGIIYSNINDYEDAMKYLLDALNVFERKHQNTLISNTYIDLSALSLKIDDYKQSFYYLNKAKNILLNTSKKNKVELSKVYSMMGVTYGYTLQKDSALLCFNKSLTYLNKEDNIIEYAGLLLNIGAIYAQKKEINLAKEHYEKALLLFKQKNYSMGIGLSLMNLAFLEKKIKNNNDATILYDKSIYFLKKSKAYYYLSDAYNNLSEIYERKNDNKNALKYYKLHIKLKEKYKNVELLSKISNMEMQFEINKKNQELEIIKRENEIKGKKQVILIGGFCLILFISILMFRNVRISLKNTELKRKILITKNVELENELTLKNKELEYFVFKIIEKNELLENLKIELSNLINEVETPDNLKKIALSIKHNLHIDNDRKELELKIDSIHNAFSEKLVSLFPKLTKTEKRLCSLIVLKISNKDIAVIMNISPETVRKSRQKLRKKFNLDENVKLDDFLEKLTTS